MKANPTTNFLLAGALALLALPSCKRNTPECATTDWKLRDSLLVIREQNLEARERAFAARTAGTEEPALTSGGTTGTTAPPVQKTTIKQYSALTTTGPKGKMPAERTALKANEKYYAAESGNYPEAGSRLLTEKDLTHLSSWGYKLMLNEIYARHGMSFTDPKLKEHFTNQSWYRTGRKNVDKYLTPTERTNIAFLKAHAR